MKTQLSIVSLALPLLAVLAIGLVMVPDSTLRAQQALPEGTVRVVLTDGTVFVGVIEREDEAEIVLRTASGVIMTIPRGLVKAITSLEGERFSRIDPNRTRLFFAPTARAVRAGAGYTAFYEIFVPFVAVGVGNAVTLAGGVTINPGSARAAYVAPKVTVLDRRSMSLAVGGIGVAVIGDGETDEGGLLFGVGTFGPSHASFSAGVGLAFGFDLKFGQNPVLMLGGEYQLSNNLKLLTENYVFVGVQDGVVVSGGLRFFGDKLAADIGFITVPSLLDEVSGFPALPWLGFAYNFGGAP